MRCYMRTNTGKIAAAATAVSVALIVLSIVDPTAAWDVRAFRLGLAGAFVSCTTWVLAHMTVSDEALEHSRQRGYEQGRRDTADLGHLGGLRALGSDNTATLLSYPRSSDQLGQKRRVGDVGEGTA